MKKKNGRPKVHFVPRRRLSLVLDSEVYDDIVMFAGHIQSVTGERVSMEKVLVNALKSNPDFIIWKLSIKK